MSTAWSCWWLTGCCQCSRQDCIVMSVHAVLQALINRALCRPLLSTHEGDESADEQGCPALHADDPALLGLYPPSRSHQAVSALRTQSSERWRCTVQGTLMAALGVKGRVRPPC